ncbi:MAG: ATP-binding protein [Desulfocapsaceae bacterium]|nr:ATP-binding protein [Desulfocapsaceae bacterium]
MIWNYILYLLYGLAFFTLGVAILSRDLRSSELGIAKILWLLALFGITHGFHEWFEFLVYLSPLTPSLNYSLFRLLLVSLSFFFLLYFGLFLIIISFYGDNALKTTPIHIKALIGLSALILIFVSIAFDIKSGGDIHIRRMVAFPGALLSGVGIVYYSRTVRIFSKKVAKNFILAGISMICYAIFTGLIPSDVSIPVLNLQIIIFRGISALFIMYFTIKALSVFSLEQNKLINEKLQRFAQSEKLASMGMLAAGIAHEINNPLTNAMLNLEMVKERLSGEEKVENKLSSIDRNLNRAAKIAGELLHFSRDKEDTFERVNLNEVITSSINLVKNQKRNVKINLSLKEIPDIMGIPYKLQEVVINILLNSMDANEEGDFIDITTCNTGNQAIMEITDTGHGIQADDLPKVFDPFYTTKEIGKGTGLGLSVCYNIVKQHNGDISLVSSENGGTVVTVSFPVGDNYE